MPSEPSIFSVVRSDGRTTVSFCDWPSVSEAIYSLELPEFLDRMQTELYEAVTENNSDVLAINLASADFLPSSFLAALVGLRKSGVTIVLLHPSVSVRQALEVTKLDQLVEIRE